MQNELQKKLNNVLEKVIENVKLEDIENNLDYENQELYLD
jgi:hypothetical protein